MTDRDSKIIEMCNSSHTLSEVGEMFGVSKQRIQQILEKNNVHKSDPKLRKSQYTEEEKQQFKTLRDEGFSWPQISNIFKKKIYLIDIKKYNGEDVKKCGYCGEILPLANFYYYPSTNQYSYRCKRCNTDFCRSYRKNKQIDKNK